MRRSQGVVALLVSLIAWQGVMIATSAMSQDRPAGFQDILRKGDVASLAAAIDKDPSLANRLDAQGVPPLFWAAFYGQKAVVELLLGRGADPRASCQFGTALQIAVRRGHADVVRVLGARGADPNVAAVGGNPLLILAAQQGALTVVEALLDVGASIGATDAMGNTALLMAASYDREAVVRLLLSKTASPTTANFRGDTPLDVARREGHSRVAAYLEAQGATGRRPGAAPSGPFLGQVRPGLEATLFAPSIVSTERRELNAAFLPDGQTLFFSRDRGQRGTAVMMTASDGRRWTMPEPAPFSRGEYSDVDAFVTPDGREIYFCSDRPLPGEPVPQAGIAPASPAAGGTAGGSSGTPPSPPPPPRVGIWIVARTASGWGEPAWLGSVVNSGAQDYYPTLTRTGTLYFSSNRQGGLGENDIYRARRVDGRWTPPESLGRGVNSEFREFDPFIAPDESYVIFASTRPGGMGGADLYISFRNARGEWDEPKNMGPSVNSAASDYTPILSPDGRSLFFTSSREGQDDIFWIDARVIAALRPPAEPTAKPPQAASSSAARQPVPPSPDTAVVEQAIRDSIGWALTKDRALLERIIAHDADLFMFNPDSKSTIVGWDAFVKNFAFWLDPRFKATCFDVRELRTTFSRSGDVAWFSAILDDLAEWDGKPTGWKDTRWTGVLEKRDGTWVIVQMHFSFASDRVRAEPSSAHQVRLRS